MTESGEGRWRSVVDRVRAQAARTPDAIAVEGEQGALTYRELVAAADRRAALLVERLAGRERLVGLCLRRTPDLPVWLLAVLRARAAWWPVDPTLPPARLAQQLENACPALIVVDRVHRAALPPTEVPVVVADRTWADRPARVAFPEEAGPDDLAYLMYTSGSTGRPKGVEIGHGAVATLLDAAAGLGVLGEGGAMLATTRLAFDLSVIELLLPLTVGGRTVLATEADAADPRRLAALIERRRPNVLQVTPTAARALVEAGWPAFRPAHLLCGGEPLLPDLAARLLPRCGALWNVYGPTETTVWSTAGRVTDAAAPIPVGRAISGAAVSILDRRLRPLAPGEEGEIVIAGPVVGRGYRGDPALTAARFVTLPDGARAFRTGDRGRMDAGGLLYCGGRFDDQVKVRGFRVEPGEVEAVLAGHPDVAGCAVRACAGPAGEAALVGYLVARNGADLPAAGLRAFLGAVLPPYMVPARFVTLARLPLTPSGKVDRRALPNPFAAPVPVAVGAAGTQAALAAIWCEVLALPAVGPDDDFFVLGGYSLLTVRLQRRIEARFGRVLELSALMAAATLAAMAALIDDDEAMATGAGVALLGGTGGGPPLFWLDVGPLLRGLAPALGERSLAALNLTRAEEAQFGAAPLAIGAVAAALRHRLARVQPYGPVYLGGWCRWGVVAHELACQLRERGRTVALLVLLDADAPRPARFAPLARVWRLLGGRPVAPEPPSLSQRVEVAARHHRARFFAGPALLLRPDFTRVDADPWSKHVASLTVEAVPGDHLTMVRPPLIATLGETIARALQGAGRRAERPVRPVGAAQAPVMPRYRMPASVPLLATTSDPSRAPLAERTTRLIE